MIHSYYSLNFVCIKFIFWKGNNFLEWYVDKFLRVNPSQFAKHKAVDSLSRYLCGK